MDIKQLEAFVQVVKSKSFSKAAEALYFTQPTISSHIASLERELGGSLIIRAPKEALPTERGKLLFEHALEILTLRDNAIELCRAQKSTTLRGTIQVAVSTVPQQYVLPRVMRYFREQYPQVGFEVISTDSKGVINEIAAGGAELGMTGTTWNTETCVYEAFMKDYLVVATPNTGEFREMKSISSEDLKKYPFVAREPGSGTRRETEQYLLTRGITPQDLPIVAQFDDPVAIKNAVCQGIGVSILPMFLVTDAVKQGQIRVFPLDGHWIKRSLYFIHHKSRRLSVAAAAFHAFIFENAKTIFPEEMNPQQRP